MYGENRLYSGLNLATVFSGLIFAFTAVFGFETIYGGLINIDTGTKGYLDAIISKIPLGVVSFIIGFFIQGIRYLGFEYYIKIHKKSQAGRLSGKKYPGILQRIFFYLFRDGTVVEECLDNVAKKYKKPIKNNTLASKIMGKQYRANYSWIQNSKRPAKDMWLYANKIREKAPKEKVYRFYYWSEVFQCADTTFFIFCIVFLLSLIANIILPIFIGRYFQTSIFQKSIPGVFLLFSFLLHKV
ncbi:MAG: hypothetical protein LBQ88_03225 [Treponema sp.]|jgi:hypothetical protein|nr:hypothetical protein [Treponema sp.]